MKDNGRSIKVDDETYKKLDQYKIDTGIPIKRIIKNAVELYLKKNGGK